MTFTTEKLVAEAPLESGDQSRVVRRDGEWNELGGAPRSSGLRLPVVLFLLVLVAIVSITAAGAITLVVTGHLDAGAFGEHVRRVME